MKKYKYIFFDLDHTLWDYESNSINTLKKLYFEYKLDQYTQSFEDFYNAFDIVNNRLWEEYNRKNINQQDIRTMRFPEIFSKFYLTNDKLAENLNYSYMEKGPRETGLIHGTRELLDYLKGNYKLSIVSNGFELTQHTKLDCSNIKTYFSHVITAENSGHVKPDREIFDFAMQLNNASSHEILMVGDNLRADILGAKNAEIDTVFFNPSGIKDTVGANYVVSELNQIKNFL